ncbi:hypothetical protein [Ferribacterium limneticum]|uniref:hypothetical protein n=1 Tax=Ferribacterium limneticum TaxID=76259 RepID=UPI001CFB14AA|nr:hypothetical protein [Ferribacterium limneticum]UCV18968.1 hypothetical protein KI610_19660 [Ferribacterium limneticum]
MTKFCGLIGLLVAASWSLAVGAEETHHPHHRLAKDVDAFHAVLAPVWHARPGPERSRNACAKAPEMVVLAGKISSTDASALSPSVGALSKVCQDGKGEIDASLFDVHEAFHRLIDSKPAK